jgi:CheY-like chemotaxis protein
MGVGGRTTIYSGRNRASIPVYPLDVFVATKEGEVHLHGAATTLPANLLSILVLLDGKATIGDIEQKATHLSSKAVRDLVRTLVAAGLVRAASIAEMDGLDFSAYFDAPDSAARLPGGAKASADKEAARGAPELAKKGFYVSIARKSAMATTRESNAKLEALVVEDDPDVASLVKRSLEEAEFAVVVATKRDEILGRLRRTPPPDVVILDVMLPDANGFDVLEKMKLHPTLRSVPVIVLTADARRESIMRGLASGADGYITKPFQRTALLLGVKAVLGI